MPLIKIDRAHLAFGHHPLLHGAQFQADRGERIALIGRNGTGKSSLLLVLAGKLALDDGEIFRETPLRLGFVPQEPLFEAGATVLSAVVAGMGEVSAVLRDYHLALLALQASPDDEAVHEKVVTLQHRMDELGGWTYQSSAEQIIHSFELTADAPVASLSGGQRKRLALAQALAMTPDLLMLDEPTNHLDVLAIVWLENLLKQPHLAKTCLIFITHDRSFLGNLATRIVELDRGMLQSFPGNYGTYLERKALMLHEEAQSNARQDKLLKAEELWIRQGVEARRTRSVYRVQQLNALRQARSERRERQGNATIALDRGEKSGQLVAELKSVHFSYSLADGREKTIVNDFSTRLLAGDKIGLIGRNGAGKTTLLRLILGELTPTSGSVRLGTRLTIAYFDQFRSALDENARLQDVVASSSEFVEINGKRKHVIGYLEDFLFPPERARSQVKMLSGGERNRLLLAKLFARPANVLVLDEPTNDLDMETLELLEQLLSDYQGTVFVVSHDRQFLDNIVTQTIVYEGEQRGKSGVWREYVGGFTDWRRQTTIPLEESFAVGELTADDSSSSVITPATEVALTQPLLMPAKKAVKLSWKENQELIAIPNTIQTLEAEQKNLTHRLEDPTLYSAQPIEAQHIAARLTTLESTLLSLLDRWEFLEQKQSSSGEISRQ
jgi:ATP-binding cassette subfamily F protein uup